MPVDSLNLVECRCPKCRFKLGDADAIGTVILYCKKCKEKVNFTLIQEPACPCVTVFIENNKINEKTVYTTRNISIV